VLFMVLAAALLPLLNASSKYLSQTYPVLEITWARYAGHLFFMLLVFAPRRGIRLLASSQPVLQLVRSTLLCVSTLVFIAGLASVMLPTATAISFTGPLIVTALSPLVLKEAVGPRRWLAIIIGFGGALVVVRPGLDPAYEGALLIFAGAFAAALYQLLTRKLAAHDPAETSITYIALAGFVLTSIPLPFLWQTPVSLGMPWCSQAWASSEGLGTTAWCAPLSLLPRLLWPLSTMASWSAQLCWASWSSGRSRITGPGWGPRLSRAAASSCSGVNAAKRRAIHIWVVQGHGFIQRRRAKLSCIVPAPIPVLDLPSSVGSVLTPLLALPTSFAAKAHAAWHTGAGLVSGAFISMLLQ
jgi:drug/metabolite transporter (DMT)-like permease